MFFDYVINFFRYFFRFLLKPIEMNTYGQKIYVKWATGIIPVRLKKDWTVADLKATMSDKLNVGVNDLHIIFAGKELHDDIKLQDCDVGEQSVIHAVQSRKFSVEVTADKQKSCSSLPVSNFCTEDALVASKKSHFFVYCNHPCHSLQPGKLRVRCRECKEGTLTVNTDPTCWDDVLLYGRIQGICHNENCDGNTAEFYFKCTQHVTSLDDSAVALYLIKNNFKNIPCIACTDVKSLVLVFPCSDGHVICTECFKLYALSCLNERRFIQHLTYGYTLNCAAGCPDSEIKEPHHFKLLGDEQYARYQQFGAEECVLQAGGVLCPQPGCGAGLLPDVECRRITCSTEGGCGFVFCRLCLERYHTGPCGALQSVESTCEFDHSITDERAGSSRWDEDSHQTIQTTTKPCPNCRTPTERSGGCMHMVCTRAGCHFDWCWICQGEWSRDCMGSHWFG